MGCMSSGRRMAVCPTADNPDLWSVCNAGGLRLYSSATEGPQLAITGLLTTCSDRGFNHPISYSKRNPTDPDEPCTVDWNPSSVRLGNNRSVWHTSPAGCYTCGRVQLCHAKER